MPHLISNLVEKGFTPFTARLAPKNLWSRPPLGKSAAVIILKAASLQRQHALALTPQWKPLGDSSEVGFATTTSFTTHTWSYARSQSITSGGTLLLVVTDASMLTALFHTLSKKRKSGPSTSQKMRMNTARNETLISNNNHKFRAIKRYGRMWISAAERRTIPVSRCTVFRLSVGCLFNTLQILFSACKSSK